MDQQSTQQIAQAREEAARLNTELRETSRLGRQVGSVMVGAFKDIAVKGKGLGDVLRSLALRMSQIVLKAAFKPLEKAVGGLFDGLLSGGLKSAFGFAKGGVFRGSMPVPFAKGGVISAPVTFPLGRGQTGIAGERGAEAIMPLARGPDGRLGVQARGGGGVSVTFNVTTPDVESFQRSQTQIAAMLARTVGQGQRNL